MPRARPLAADTGSASVWAGTAPAGSGALKPVAGQPWAEGAGLLPEAEALGGRRSAFLGDVADAAPTETLFGRGWQRRSLPVSCCAGGPGGRRLLLLVAAVAAAPR